MQLPHTNIFSTSSFKQILNDQGSLVKWSIYNCHSMLLECHENMLWLLQYSWMPYGSSFHENNPIGSKEGFWHFVRDHDAATASAPAFLLPVGGHLRPGARGNMAARIQTCWNSWDRWLRQIFSSSSTLSHPATNLTLVSSFSVLLFSFSSFSTVFQGGNQWYVNMKW